MGEGHVEAGGPVAVDAHGTADDGVEQVVDTGAGRPHVGAHGLADRRGAGRRAADAQSQHGAAGVARAEGSEGGAGRAGAIDHHRAERFGGGGLERGLPARVDLDDVEQRAHDAVDLGEPFGPGGGPGLVEGELEGIGAGDPRAALAVGLGEGIGGGLDRLLGLRLLGGETIALGLEPGEALLGVGHLGPQALGLGDQTVALFDQRGGAGVGPLELGQGTGDGLAQTAELATHLGGFARHRGHTVAPALLEGGSGIGEATLGSLDLVDLGNECGSCVVDGGQFVAEASLVGFERGDEGGVDAGLALLGQAALALGEHGGHAASALAQRLEAGELVAHVGTAHGVELGLGAHHGGVELGEAGAQRLLGVDVTDAVAGGVVEAGAQLGQLATGEEPAQGGELGDERAVAPGGLGLAFEGAQATPDLTEQVLDAGQVRLGGGQAALGLLLALAELEDAGGLFDDEAPFGGLGVEDGVDLALADDDVLHAPDARVGQQVLDVEQPAGHAVDGVLGLARAEQRPADGDLGELDGEQARRVVDGEAHLGAPQCRALGGAGEDDIVHLLGAHGGGGLGTQDPRDGVDDVGLARAVGTDHHGDAGLQPQIRGVGERLEALDGQVLEEHRPRR